MLYMDIHAWMPALYTYVATLYVMLYNYIQYIFTQNLHVYIHLHAYVATYHKV